jgi:tellurite resistance protein
MHIVIAALGSLVTILWLLHRLAEMGIDLGGLNPWAWRRRRKWRSAYEANPIFAITSPMDLTALLIAATAKADGDMSSDEKAVILEMFQGEFHLSERDAASLLASSTHLLGKGDEVRDGLVDVMRPAKESFTVSQARSALAMIERIASVGETTTAAQDDLVARINAELLPVDSDGREWT